MFGIQDASKTVVATGPVTITLIVDMQVGNSCIAIRLIFMLLKSLRRGGSSDRMSSCFMNSEV
jgi:hypothetical protein